MPFSLDINGSGPGQYATREQIETSVNDAILEADSRAKAAENAGVVLPLTVTGTADAMVGTIPATLSDATMFNGRVMRFISPGTNTAAAPTLTVLGVTYEIRGMNGAVIPAGALTQNRYLAFVHQTTPSPQIRLVSPVQIDDIPNLGSRAALQRGSVAAAANLNLITLPGVYFLAANGGYTGMPVGALASSAHWLEVRNYGGAGGVGNGRFVLQRLISMASVLPGGPSHYYRPAFERRLDSDNPTDAGNVAAWLPIHAITPLAGKTIVVLGDSIVQGGGGWDWPAMLAGLTGATVVNGGFGGCRMGVHSNALFDPFSMYRVSERIRYGDWSVLTAAANALWAAQADDRRPAAARLAALDWSRVDYIVVAYGTNDFGGNVPIGAAGDASGASFCGAINVSIANIMAAYPAAQILWATPLWRSRVAVNGDDSNVTPNGLGDHLVEYVQALKERVAAYQMPLVDLHATSGMNILNWSTLMPDGLHPWSIPGVERVARQVAGALVAIA